MERKSCHSLRKFIKTEKFSSQKQMKHLKFLQFLGMTTRFAYKITEYGK